jgi:SsrA-binding protein
MSTKAPSTARIADNKKAIFNYFIEERFEAGMVLEGWEVQSVREGKVQLTDGYVVIRNGELFVIGCQINPLNTASTHVRPDSVRTKKLLLQKDEIRRLIGKVEQKGYTLVPLNLHWKNGKIKCEIALAKGKADQQAKRAAVAKGGSPGVMAKRRSVSMEPSAQRARVPASKPSGPTPEQVGDRSAPPASTSGRGLVSPAKGPKQGSRLGSGAPPARMPAPDPPKVVTVKKAETAAGSSAAVCNPSR